MHDTTTMTIRLANDLKKKLDRLTELTRRSRSFLAAEAVRHYVERELEILEGIARSLEDVEAGQVVSHADAMQDIENTIKNARRQRR
jgi:predicted transcriptional regulator